MNPDDITDGEIHTIIQTTGDDELDAMRQMVDTLDDLSPRVRQRVLRWAAERYEERVEGTAS